MAAPVPIFRGRTEAAAEQWQDWRWQAKHAVTTLEELETRLVLTDEEREGARRALAQGLPMSITPYYLGLCHDRDPTCPIRLQCVPRSDEQTIVAGDLRDPLGEEAHEVAPHLIQRYPDRALLITTDRCSVYCRFCTRSRLVGHGGGARSLDALEPALRWLHEHDQVRDVILSGGDPMLMATERLHRILSAVAEVPHLDTIRLATRLPVTLPQRISAELCEAIRSTRKATWIMTHFNHPKELTSESMAACGMLADHGLPLMNQTVLLRGVNDDAVTLTELFRGLVRNRVRPYYLLQMDPVRGTSHLRTSLRDGIELIGALQGHLSGIALPKFIVDTPGGRGKVPVGPNYVVRASYGRTTLKTFRGELVDYVDPPAAVSPPQGQTWNER